MRRVREDEIEQEEVTEEVRPRWWSRWWGRVAYPKRLYFTPSTGSVGTDWKHNNFSGLPVILVSKPGEEWTPPWSVEEFRTLHAAHKASCCRIDLNDAPLAEGHYGELGLNTQPTPGERLAAVRMELHAKT
jgi:hypothetical protein